MAIQAQLCTDKIGFPLCGSQDWIDSGYGCVNSGFNHFWDKFQQQPQQLQQQQQQHMQQLQNQQQRNQSMCFDNSLVGVPTTKNYNHNNHQSMAYPLITQAEKQTQEIDHYIRSQNERLRMFLQEQKRQQFAFLVKKIESKASILLRQKDEEIARATKKLMELENFMKRLEMENQTWQRVAQENEAMVVTLNNTLEELRERACCCFNNDAEDAESCCDVNSEHDIEETEENRGNRGFCGNEDNGEEERKLLMVCKGCNSQNACVLFLPCRHLCSCKVCEAFLDSCPICGIAKKASIEALIF